MAKRAKEKEVKHKNNTKIKNKNQKNNVQKETKEEKFDFNEEIVIGLTRIDNKKEELKKTKNKNKNQKNNKSNKNVNKKQASEKKTQNITNKKNGKNNKKKEDDIKNIIPKKPQKKLTKEQQLAKKKRMAIFKVIKWTGLIVIIIAGIIYALLSPLFNIKQIRIEGNSKISDDEIISLSKIVMNTNTFKYSMGELKNNIKQNAYIESIEVKRKLPNDIELHIVEREPSYMIQIGNAYAYIDNQGYILEISSQKQKLPILLETETLQENIQAGKRLCTEDLKKLSDVLRIMESANSNGIHEFITKINIKDPSNYILILDSEKKTVYLGDTSNLSTKMLWVITLNDENKKDKGIIFLNMNLNNENSKPYFRKDI